MSEAKKTRPELEPGAPEPQVVALGYQPSDQQAPTVLARGRGEIARNILERAAEHDVPIQRDPDLLQCLAPLEVGVEIPEKAYAAVARVLAFLYRVNAEAR